MYQGSVFVSNGSWLSSW